MSEGVEVVVVNLLSVVVRFWVRSMGKVSSHSD